LITPRKRSSSRVLVNQEADAGDRPCLCLDDNIGKPCQPSIDVKARLLPPGFAVAMDRFRECRETPGPSEVLGQCSVNRATDLAIAILKRMDASNQRCEDGARVIAEAGLRRRRAVIKPR
jgi:hypothetical protein